MTRPGDALAALEALAPGDHMALFYDDDGAMYDYVAHFLAAGAKRGEAPAVLAVDADARLARLTEAGYPADKLRARGELRVLDAAPVVARLRQGEDGAIADAIARARPPAGHRRLRVAGFLGHHMWRAGLARRAVAAERALPHRLPADATLLCAHDARELNPRGAWDAWASIAYAHRHVVYVGTEWGAVQTPAPPVVAAAEAPAAPRRKA